VPTRFSQFFAAFFLLWISVCSAQETAQVKPILKLDGWSQGPFEGQESISCLTIYSDGKITYFHRRNSRKIRVEAKTGKKSLVEQTVSVESQLTRADLLELTGFLESNVVKALGESFVVPHSPIDYSESATVHIIGPSGNEKAVSINGYSVAGLEQKSQLPGTLVVLMDKIEEIEKAAALKGKDTKTPPGCLEALKRAGP
jgi:sulfur carrier protein ThiS